jgi:hypothetical protein
MAGYKARRALAFDDMNFKGHHLVGIIWPMISSRTGEEYEVELTDKGFTCTCIGFQTRGKCKHVTEIHDRMVCDV